MIKASVLMIGIFASIGCGYTQQASKQENKSVTVRNWGQKSYMIANEFWEQTKTQIIQKLGKEKFDTIRYYSDNANIPNSLLQFDGIRKVPIKEYLQRLSSLKVYKAADLDYTYDGKILKYSVLSVPYQKLYWDEKTKWNTVYFVILSEEIQ